MNTQVISIEQFNEFFKNKEKYLVKTLEGHQGVIHYDGTQGEYNETYKFYKHGSFPKNVFLRETVVTDSYGEGEFTTLFQFVEGKEKTIITYEPI